MLKKIFFSLILFYGANTIPMQPGSLGSDFNSYVGNLIVSNFNALHTTLHKKDTEIKALQKDLDETKKLLEQLRLQMQRQNELLKTYGIQ